jgi:hypothetical protein
LFLAIIPFPYTSSEHYIFPSIFANKNDRLRLRLRLR